MCREVPTEKETTTETVAFSRHNGACREETPEVCTMARGVHKCGPTARVSDLVQASEESDKGRQGQTDLMELEDNTGSDTPGGTR